MPFAGADEPHAPGESGRTAEDFGVHEVAGSDHGADEGYRNDEPVESPEGASPGCEKREAEDTDDYADSATVGGEAAVPYLDDFGGVGAVVVPFVEENVAEASANDCACQSPHQKDSEPAFGSTFVSEHASYDFVANQESEGKHHSIPANGYGVGDYFGICVPDYIVQHRKKKEKNGDSGKHRSMIRDANLSRNLQILISGNEK